MIRDSYAIPYPATPPLERGLDLFFPPVCVGCGRVGRWICTHCWPAVSWMQELSCYRCGSALSDWECGVCPPSASGLRAIFAVATFEATSREAVHALKFENRHAIAGLMGRLMAYKLRDVPADFVAPVPLHSSRRRERGYDQAALLAKMVSKSLGRPYAAALLRRSRATVQQATLDREARYRNVLGAFEVRGQLAGRTILLVDDVATTGATLEAAASALTGAGATCVYGAVFAQAIEPAARPAMGTSDEQSG